MNEIIWSIIAGTGIIAVLVLGIGYTFFKANRDKRKQESILLETKRAFEEEIRGVETEVQEQLMSSIANELHDNAGQLLTAMHIEIHNLKTDFPEQVENYALVETYLEEVIQLLRLLGKSLNTDFINDSGLVAAMEVEAERINSLRRFKVQLDIDRQPSKLEKNQELVLFRIFQEIIQNGLKHSKAKNIQVKLRFEPFSLHIIDDGIGFDPDEIKRNNKASGLRNIEKRASLVQMKCTLTSEVGKGTEYYFQKEMVHENRD